jgi:hypothetical protein
MLSRNAYADDLKSRVATLEDILAVTPIPNDVNVARRRWNESKKAVDDARGAYAETSREKLGYFGEERAQHQKLHNEWAARLAAAAAQVARAHDAQEARRADVVRAEERVAANFLARVSAQLAAAAPVLEDVAALLSDLLRPMEAVQLFAARHVLPTPRLFADVPFLQEATRRLTAALNRRRE